MAAHGSRTSQACTEQRKRDGFGDGCVVSQLADAKDPVVTVIVELEIGNSRARNVYGCIRPKTLRQRSAADKDA